jgi:peptidoglycan/LPS O-acetylase OafA/YrhL
MTDTISSIDEKKDFPALRGLRIVAAYLVFFHHFPLSFLYAEKFDFQQELHIGVSVFFVMSGFLIGNRYQDNLSLNPKWLFNYFKNRFARIYPAYLLMISLTLLINHITDLKIWFLNLTLFKGLFDSYKFSGIMQSWTLTVEECFYFSAPFIFFFAKKYNSLIRPFLFFCILLPLIILSGKSINQDGFLSPPFFLIMYTFFGRFFEFFVGLYLAQHINKPLIAGLRFKTISGCGGIILCIIIFTLLKTTEHAYGVSHPFGLLTNNYILPVCIAFLIAGLILEKTMISKLLSTKVFQLLGRSSYIFYLIHFGIIMDFFMSDLTENYFLLFILINLASIILYKLFEEPMHKMIRT